MTKKGNYKDMTELFNLAACKALHMSQPSPPKISIGIEIGQPPMNGGLSSIQESMNIGGEPHRLSYINSDEASLLRQLGGSGQPVNGIPAYDYSGAGWDAGPGDAGMGWDDTATGPSAAEESDMYNSWDMIAHGPTKADKDDLDAALAAESAQAQAYYATPKGIMELQKAYWAGPHMDPWSGKNVFDMSEEEDALQAKMREGPAYNSIWDYVLSLFVPGGFVNIGKMGYEDFSKRADHAAGLTALATNLDMPLSVRAEAANALEALTSPDTKDEGDYSDTEGDRILKERTKAARPCVPGEAGWPECEADVEEKSPMSKYFAAMSKDKDSDDPTEERMRWWNSLPQHIQDSLRLTYPEEGKGGIPEKLLADIA